MKVLRDKVIELCGSLGFSTAAKWNRAKMAAQLKKIAELAETKDFDVEDKGQAALLQEIVALKGEVEVVQNAEDLGDEPRAKAEEVEVEENSASEPDPSEGAAPAKCHKCGGTEFDEDGDCKACMEPSKPKPEKKAKAPKEPKAPKAKKEKGESVYTYMDAIKEVLPAGGRTRDEMVAEVYELYKSKGKGGTKIQAERNLDSVLRPLTIFGFVEKAEDGKVSLVRVG